MIRARLFLIIALATATAACDAPPYYENSWSSSDGMWTWSEDFASEFEIRDTSDSYDLLLEISHTTGYPYQNIYLKAETVFPSDTAVSSLLPVEMASKSGSWLGRCRGDRCRLTVVLGENVTFGEPGLYNLTFRQYTRRDSLNGINSLKFIVKNHDDENY